MQSVFSSQPSSVARLEAAFRAARAPTSHAKDKVSVTELRGLVRVALEDGVMTADEKACLARNWSALLDGARFHATAAAQREYAKLQATHALPRFPSY